MTTLYPTPLLFLLRHSRIIRSPSSEYEYEVFKMTQPGLSSFGGNPERAVRSLDVLPDEVVRVVPKATHGYTLVAVKVTAGFRLLPGSQSADILMAAEGRIQTSYPYRGKME
jgi:guanosine-diphosphatase